MEHKKGFTLVELLAVITLLAILVLLAMPNILNVLNEAKKKTFLNEVMTIYNDSASKYIDEILQGNKLNVINSKDESKLNLDGEKTDYCVLLNNKGEVNKIAVGNNSFHVILDEVKDKIDITVDDIKDGKLPDMECSASGFAELKKDDENNNLAGNDAVKIIDYIMSDGNQYINTGYIPSLNTKIVFTHEPIIKSYPAWTAYFGSRDKDKNTNAFFVATNLGNMSAWVASTQPTRGNAAYTHTLGSTQVITLTASQLTIDENGVNKLTKINNNTTTFTNAREIYIFGRNNGNVVQATGAFKLKAFQIYESDKLVMDLVPAIDDKDVYCLYDNISKKYFYNQGTGKFNDEKKDEEEVISACTSGKEFKLGSTYDNGKYRYTYYDETGWKVEVKDKASTAALSAPTCSTVDGKPIVSMDSMFADSKSTSIDLNGIDTSKVTNMASMFSGSAATVLNLSDFDTSQVKNMSGMFFSSAATSITFGTKFNTSNVKSMSYMFYYSAVTSLDLTGFDTSQVERMESMFSGISVDKLDLSSFNTSKVTNMSDMFKNSKATKGYARTQSDANKFNSSSNRPSALNFVVR